MSEIIGRLSKTSGNIGDVVGECGYSWYNCVWWVATPVEDVIENLKEFQENSWKWNNFEMDINELDIFV